jgi:hypothetical protein
MIVTQSFCSTWEESEHKFKCIIAVSLATSREI